MTVIGVARQGGDMGDELAALAAINRRRHAHLDAELIGPVGFPLADAFDLGGMERIDLGAPLAPVLSVDAAGEMQRPGEDLLQLALALDPALDVADHPAELGFERPERLAGALELRSEEPTSELQSLMRISYAVLCLTTIYHSTRIIT